MKPKIIIKHGKLLEPFFRVFISQKYPDYIFHTNEEVLEKVKIFKNNWSMYEDKFLIGLKELGLEFVRNRIDVLIISATDRDMSSPLIIRSRYDQKEFISVLCHELLHVLFADNKFVQKYEEESQTTRNHIYVFAVLKYLFVDVFNEPERLDTEKSKSSLEKNIDYYKAWQIVEKDGYKNILHKLKTHRID
jgi:hypothetical protein